MILIDHSLFQPPDKLGKHLTVDKESLSSEAHLARSKMDLAKSKGKPKSNPGMGKEGDPDLVQKKEGSARLLIGKAKTRNDRPKTMFRRASNLMESGLRGEDDDYHDDDHDDDDDNDDDGDEDYEDYDEDFDYYYDDDEKSEEKECECEKVVRPCTNESKSGQVVSKEGDVRNPANNTMPQPAAKVTSFFFFITVK